MTTAPVADAARLRPADVPRVVSILESDFGRLPDDGAWDPRHHYLLDALERGEHGRFVAWPLEQPHGLLYVGLTGTVVAAGRVDAAGPLSQECEASRWRILVGDEALVQALLQRSRRGWFRRARSRQQRFMTADPTTMPASSELAVPVRRAVHADLDAVTTFACKLHVEDRMGPPVTGAARLAVRSRMAESVSRGLTFVIDLGTGPVGKLDLSLRSRRRGAQIAGVYVAADHRGRGYARRAVGQVTRGLLDEGLPVVSLHVRSDNVSALRAYRRAGFVDRGPWALALR